MQDRVKPLHVRPNRRSSCACGGVWSFFY
jgi:hypothetical protein